MNGDSWATYGGWDMLVRYSAAACKLLCKLKKTNKQTLKAKKKTCIHFTILKHWIIIGIAMSIKVQTINLSSYSPWMVLKNDRKISYWSCKAGLKKIPSKISVVGWYKLSHWIQWFTVGGWGDFQAAIEKVLAQNNTKPNKSLIPCNSFLYVSKTSD